MPQTEVDFTSRTAISDKMGLESDISVNFSKFDPKPVNDGPHTFNKKLMNIMASGPKWYEVLKSILDSLTRRADNGKVGAETYRKTRWNGEKPLPKPVVVESGKSFAIPSREAGRMIPYRYFVPGDGIVNGVYIHICGGGWVLQTEE